MRNQDWKFLAWAPGMMAHYCTIAPIGAHTRRGQAAISASGGSAFSGRPKAQLWMVALVCGVPLLLPSLAPTLGLALMTVFVHEMGWGAIHPLVFRDFNRHVIAEKRSTTNSIRSSVGYLGNASGLLLSGLATFLISPTRIWAISALVLVWLGWYIRPRND